MSPDVTNIDYKGILSYGWYMFSIAWSKKDNFIKFIIGEKTVGECEFKDWPTESHSFFASASPKGNQDHYFESLMGPIKFIPSKYSQQIINELFNEKPNQGSN